MKTKYNFEVRQRMVELTDQADKSQLNETLNSIVKDLLEDGFETEDIAEYLQEFVTKSIKEFE